MSLRTALPPRIRLPPSFTSSCTTTRATFTRPFFTLPTPNTSTTQHLTATRTLPYSVPRLYALIADVDSYSSFVPYCSHSRVTAWSTPPTTSPDSSPDVSPNADATANANANKSWPTQADLHVGWGGFSEVFTSKLRCIPDESVEAISGGEDTPASTVFKSLVTRWSVREAPAHPPALKPGQANGSVATEVNLTIKYEFSNPLYAAVSAAVSDKVAGLMIEAFEKRAREKLGGQDRL